MAMSRSIGDSSLTTVSPIRIWPEVIDSSPATMRSVVVLPQPDGPTSTTNSSSRTSRFTSLTTCTSSNFLFRRRIKTCAIASTFDGAGDPGDVMLDEEGVDERHRDRPQERPCHQRSPEEDVAADQLGSDAHRHGLLLGRGEEDQRVDELVPRQCEGEDPRGEDARNRDREDDVNHRLPARRAIDARAFLE